MDNFTTTMKPMARNLPALPNKYPMHIVQSRSHGATGKETGLTFSVEENPNQAASAEYEVLKAIVSREQYLIKLHLAVRTVGKTFKPEVADAMDLVRMASLDVIEKVQVWRESKNDMDASFIWNGVNYLLKMPSDLDYLADYLAVQRWAGFALIRNPFVVPFPMDPSVVSALENSSDPKHMDKTTSMTEGFAIGKTTGTDPTRQSSAEKKGGPASASPSPYLSGKIRAPSRSGKRAIESGTGGGTGGGGGMQSFVFNEDMRRIRIAEGIIMKVEAQFGIFSRDPDGRLAPILQALTKKAAVELKKDDKRTITEPSHTVNNYAPYALKGGIGLAEVAWAPNTVAGAPVDESKLVSKWVKEKDESVNAKQRGAKSGGSLKAADTKGSSTRPRKPIKASISSRVDFNRYRSIQSLGERLEEIYKLKEEIAKIKESGQGGVVSSRPGTGGMGGTGGAVVGVMQSTLSNQFGSGGLSGPFIPTPINVDPKSFPPGYLNPLQPNAPNAKQLDFSKVYSDSGRKEDLYEKSQSVPNLREEFRMKVAVRGGKDGKDGSAGGVGFGLGETSSPSKALAAAPNDQDKLLKQLYIEEVAIERRLRKLQEEEDINASLKQHEVDQKAQQRARDIERKRRLLSEEEAKRLGPALEEDANVYDYYATKIQSATRGWLVRRWVRWYIEVSGVAAVVVQSVIRGWLGRMRVRRIRTKFKSATIIQKNFRGWRSRGTSAAMAKKQNLTKNAIMIQRIWRGVLGKRRANDKKDLDKAAKEAFDAVDAQSLVASDVKELAHRIIYAIEEPSTTSFPPDEVLHLVRQTVLIIQSARGYLGLTDYDFFNNRQYNEIGGDEMDWKQAGKIVNRSETFIRLVRALAYGPGAKPPRLIQLPTAVNALFAAQANNPNWNIYTFERMGKGSRICCQLFKWLTAMIEISERQQQFMSLIATSFPDWLPKMNELQQTGRLCEFEIELNRRCLEVLQEHKLTREDDEEYVDILDKEIKYVRKASNDAKGRLKSTIAEISKLKNDQSTREMVALQTLEQRLDESRQELDELSKALKDATEKAELGDRAAKEAIQELRLRVTNQKLKTSEMEGQRRLLELQVESNKAKRRASARLASNTIYRTVLAGEAKAAYIIAQVDAKAMLRNSGVKHASDLPGHLADMYEPLAAREEKLRVEARSKFVLAEQDRKSFEDYLGRSLVENDLKEQKSKSRMTPTEQELEEERLENEAEAKQERRKHMQFLPDSVLHSAPTRPRPVIVALSRDLPAHAKRKIYNHLVTSMPGTFVYLNAEVNFGLDVQAIQTVFDAKKCAIINVDHGITRATRDSFLNALDLTLHSLLPTPIIALAIGSDRNIRTSATSPDCGADKRDLYIMRDGRLKVCLEALIYLINECKTSRIRKLAMERATEVTPTSQSLAIVLEASYMFYAEEKAYELPFSYREALTWTLTRRMLLDLTMISQKIYSLRRGQLNLSLLTCLQNYFKHPHWPSSHGEERNNDYLLHTLASLLEQMVECEMLYMQCGGAPPAAFTKSSMHGVQSVVVISDVENDTGAISKAGRRDGVSWVEGAALLMKAALEDLRVLKTVLKIDNSPCQVSVYRETSTVFFEVYDSISSQTFVATVSAYDIPAMLVPNGTERNNLLPAPDTPLKMYERLITLLKFYRPKPVVDNRKQLICLRDYAFLQQFVCRLSGHLAVLKCYEAALGELYFQAYLPERTAYVEVLLDTNARLKLIRDAENNSDNDTQEFEFAQSEDARPLLCYIVDRLRVSPSVSMLGALLPNLLTICKSRLNGYETPKIEQGFNLKIRVKGGAGRRLFKAVQTYLGVRFLIEFRISSPNKILMVRAYEPITRQTVSVKLDSYTRRVCIGFDDDECSKWSKEVLRRLRIDWRGEKQLLFDRTILRQITMIKDNRYVVSALATSADTIELRLVDVLSNDVFSCPLDESQMNAFLQLVPNTEASKTDISHRSEPGKVVQNLREVHDSSDNALLERNREYIPVNIETVMKDKRMLRTLIHRITMYLTPVEAKNMRHGFITHRCPVYLKFAYNPDLATREKALNTALRERKARLVDKPSDFEPRKQGEVVNLEIELDVLAMQKAHEADVLTETHVEKAKDLTSYIQSLPDPVVVQKVIKEQVQSTADSMMQTFQERIMERLKERNDPGSSQYDVMQRMEESKQSEVKAAEEAEKAKEEDVILEGIWRVALEMGVKSNFREGKVQWQGHIAVKVLETNCWIGSAGMGKCYKFIVYEPNVAQHFEGMIRSKKHLIEVLGSRGQDLLDDNKEKEMLIFICRYRLEVVVNKVDALGQALSEDAPPFRIEFMSERLYSQDKVTPVNANTEEDEEANSKKLMEIENARGRKIMRLVRRVSGILLQLTVFELPQAVAEAAMIGYIPSNPAHLGIDVSIPELAAAVSRGENEVGFAEVRTILNNLKRHMPPAFRVVGYDPRSKRKVVLSVQPQAILEVAGGVFSPYLNPDKRKDLSKVVCDALMLFFPANKPYELTIPWSGAKNVTSNAEVGRDKKVSNRSSAERVMQRKGRIFRSGMRISKYDLVLSVFQDDSDAAMLSTQGMRLIFNFYSPSVSEAAEVVIDESQQLERMGKLITSNPEGSIRAAAIRRFCRFFRAEIIEDILDPTHRTLHVILLPPDKGFVSEYQYIRVPPPGENIRPVGLPGIFAPLDTCGNAIHRRGMTLFNRDRDTQPQQKEFLVTVYTKSPVENPERGLVIKLYDRATSQTSVLHLGPSELMRICKHADEPDLMADMVTAQIMQDQSKVDDIEEGFKEFTRKGELESKTKALVDIYVDVVLRDLGFFMSPQDTVVPYVLSSPKGIFPQ